MEVLLGWYPLSIPYLCIRWCKVLLAPVSKAANPSGSFVVLHTMGALEVQLAPVCCPGMVFQKGSKSRPSGARL